MDELELYRKVEMLEKRMEWLQAEVEALRERVDKDGSAGVTIRSAPAEDLEEPQVYKL